MKHILPLPFCMLLLLSACGEVDPKDCSMAECSNQFNVVRLSVRDSNNIPVALDSFGIMCLPDSTPLAFLPNGKPLTVAPVAADGYVQMLTSGMYPIANDSVVPLRENTQLKVLFTGSFKSQKFTKELTLDIDCCHVSPDRDMLLTVPNFSAGDCSTVTCTGLPVSMTVNVRYPDNTPVALDSFYVLNMSAKPAAPLVINFTEAEFSAMQSAGAYPLAHDSLLLAGFQNRRVALQFTGISGARKLVNNIIVDVDCCHISLHYGSLIMDLFSD